MFGKLILATAVVAPLAQAAPILMALWWQKKENFATQYRVGIPVGDTSNGVLLTTRPNPLGNDFYGGWYIGNHAGGNWELKTVDGKRMCLDAGLDTHDGTRAKLWQCYDGAPQQTFTFDGRLRLTNTSTCHRRGMANVPPDYCLDLVDGNPNAGLQFWTCYPNNDNQYWNIYGKGPPY